MIKVLILMELRLYLVPESVRGNLQAHAPLRVRVQGLCERTADTEKANERTRLALGTEHTDE